MEYLNRLDTHMEAKFTTLVLYLAKHNMDQLQEFLNEHWNKHFILDKILEQHFYLLWEDVDLHPYLFRLQLDVALSHFFFENSIKIVKYNQKNYLLPNQTLITSYKYFMEVYKRQFQMGYDHYPDIIKMIYIFEKIMKRSCNKIKFV